VSHCGNISASPATVRIPLESSQHGALVSSGVNCGHGVVYSNLLNYSIIVWLSATGILADPSFISTVFPVGLPEGQVI
jgi:hypothetical protein